MILASSQSVLLEKILKVLFSQSLSAFLRGSAVVGNVDCCVPKIIEIACVNNAC